MYKSIFSTLVVIIIGVGTASAQQISMFNSYTLNQFLINPSYAGLNGKTNIFGINRIQYAGFDGAPVTYMLTADAGFKDKKFGVGGLLFSDRNALIAQNGFQLTYAYSIKLNENWNIGMGLNAGMVQWTLNFDQLNVDDLDEDVLSNYKSNSSTFRSDFGLRINSDKIEFGLAIPQVVTSKVKYSDYVKNANGKYTSIPHYIANLSYLVAIKDYLTVKPMVVVRGAQGIKPQIDVVGLVDWKNKAYASVGYRTGYAVSIGGGMVVSKGLTFGYTFDRPLNAINTVTAGSHEIMVGISIGQRSAEKPEPAKGISLELEAKLKSDIEKHVNEKLSVDFEAKLKQELETRVNTAVNSQIEKALADRPVQTTAAQTIPAQTTPVTAKTTPVETKSTPAPAAASISREDLDKIKKEIEEKIQKQMSENFTKLIDEKIKKIAESKPAVATPAAIPAQPNKEELEKARKESEAKIRKELEESLRKELIVTINQAVDSKLETEMQKAKDEASKAPKEFKMTASDKATIDELKSQSSENQKKISDLEFQLKNFPESNRVENEQMRNISRVVHQNDIELKDFKLKNKGILDVAKDAPAKKVDKNDKTDKTETTEEASKFVLVIAAFKSLKEAQSYQMLAAQTFEFPNTKILKPETLEGWFFVYQKSFEKKKMAWEAHEKIVEQKLNTPNFPWIFVAE